MDAVQFFRQKRKFGNNWHRFLQGTCAVCQSTNNPEKACRMFTKYGTNYYQKALAWQQVQKYFFIKQLLNTRTHTHTQPFHGRLGCVRDNRHQKGKTRKGKTNLDLLQQEIVSGSGISWAIYKSAPWLRHITKPASHHSALYNFVNKERLHFKGSASEYHS